MLLVGFFVVLSSGWPIDLASRRRLQESDRAVGTIAFGAPDHMWRFLLIRNIFNSDNYRYLIYLLTPWSLGFGLRDERPDGAGTICVRAAALLTVMLSVGCDDRATHCDWYHQKASLPGSMSGSVVSLPVHDWLMSQFSWSRQERPAT